LEKASNKVCTVPGGAELGGSGHNGLHKLVDKRFTKRNGKPGAHVRKVGARERERERKKYKKKYSSSSSRYIFRLWTIENASSSSNIAGKFPLCRLIYRKE